MKKIILVGSLLLAGCGSLGTSDPYALAKGLITACDAAATAEDTITVFINNGKIKPVSFPAIKQFMEPIKAFCDPTSAMPADLVGATQQVIRATTALLTLKPQV